MKTFVDKVLAQAEFQPARLLEVLRAVQAEFRHIPEPAIELIAVGLQIPRTQIIAVAEFYSFLHLAPQGRYELYIADSITDRMLGNQQVLEALAARLQV
ncbi:NADH-quinone oxidoreductase subunit NuoE family protein, partial [Methylomonas koyamae]